MDSATCRHKEQISNVASGIEEGVCAVCHQVRRFEWIQDKKGDKNRQIARLIKLGRLDGKIVLPGPNDIVDLSPEETADLKAATPAHNPNNPEADADSLPPVPPRPKRKSQRIQYFEENKESILQDYRSLKLNEFYNKWHMTSTTWTKLKRAWEIAGKSPIKSVSQSEISRPRKHKGPPSIEAVSRALKEQGKNHLPPFPDFNDSWSFPVQEQWLSSYVELRRLGK